MAFANFDPARVAKFGEADRERLLQDEGIIRNRAKVASAVRNAAAFLEVQAERGSFDDYVWEFVGGAPRRNGFRALSELPPETEQSKALSKDLKARGFNFVGPHDLLRLHAVARPREPTTRWTASATPRSERAAAGGRRRRSDGQAEGRRRRSPPSSCAGPRCTPACGLRIRGRRLRGGRVSAHPPHPELGALPPNPQQGSALHPEARGG